MNKILTGLIILIAGVLVMTPELGFTRDLEYQGSEVTIYVNPGEPTQINFPDKVEGGWKKSGAPVGIERKGKSLIVFGQEELGNNGEALIVQTKEGSSYSLRIKPADTFNPRDDMVTIIEARDYVFPTDEERPAYESSQYDQAPNNSVSGLMREMALVAEFGKPRVPGYRISTQNAGEVIFDDGTMLVTIDMIFIGADHWGYVLNAQNVLETTQQLNPATFRVDGTRAIMAQRWELSAQPYTAEQQLAGKHRAKVYVVTRAK